MLDLTFLVQQTAIARSITFLKQQLLYVALICTLYAASARSSLPHTANAKTVLPYTANASILAFLIQK